MNRDGYEVIPLPKTRRLVRDFWLVHHAYTMRGLLEIDVTHPRQLVREHKSRTGEALSFTAFLTTCVAQTVARNKEIQAIPNWRGDLVVFDDVDIGVLIERESAELKFPLAHIVRAADKKSLRQIHDEIRQVQANPVEDKELKSLNSIVRLPAFLRRIVLLAAAKSPRTRKERMGTVSLSAVGMFGTTAGWGMVPNFHSLALVVGGIAEKPGVNAGRIEVREYLQLTLDFDHNVVDGAPAARFAQQLATLIKEGYGLSEALDGLLVTPAKA